MMKGKGDEPRVDWFARAFLAGGPVLVAAGACALAIGMAAGAGQASWADAPLALMFLGALMRALGAYERAQAREQEKERVARERRAARMQEGR